MDDAALVGSKQVSEEAMEAKESKKQVFINQSSSIPKSFSGKKILEISVKKFLFGGTFQDFFVESDDIKKQ